MYIRRTLKELGNLAVDEIGFCVGIYWKSVTGRRVPEGMISPNCRLAYVMFTGFDPARVSINCSLVRASSGFQARASG